MKADAQDSTHPVDSIPCWHCDQPVINNTFQAMTPDGHKTVCCPGCKAAVETIFSLDLQDYYQWRTAPAEQPDATSVSENELCIFSLEEAWRPYVTSIDKHSDENSLLRIRLDVQGIRCAACVWLIEKALNKLNGVERIQVNLATHKLIIDWQPDRIELIEIMRELFSLGYSAQLNDSRIKQTTSNQLLGRLVVAALGCMQAMMYALALYTESYSDLEPIYRDLFRWFSFIVVTPVVFYSGWPILSSGINNIRLFTRGLTLKITSGLKTDSLIPLNMDVPISLAILLAWAGSLHATLFKGPHVYFESAAMFVFFLTLSRWLEARQADRAENLLQSSIASIRPIVKRYRSHLATNGNANDIETIHINQVQAGDHILVEQGDAIPVDSILLEGDIYVSEAILTGESAVVRHLPNSTLLAGSKVYEGIGRIQATSSFTQSRIAKIEQLAADAENQSNPLDQILGRVASVFVPATMLLAIFACWLYWSQGIDRAIEVTLAVLVITCPCALSLAVPLARSAAVRAALNQAILVCKPQMLYQAKSINTLIMDKTGTLTTGNYLLVDMQMLANDITREDVIRIAMTLEQFSSHPVARAFTPEMIKQSHVYDSLAKDQVFKQVTLADHQHFRGGVSGLIGDKHYRLSSDNNIGFTDNNTASNSSTGQTVLQLTRNGRRIARFQLADQLRKEAVQIIDYYKSAGIKTILLSGDQEAATRHLAQQAGFDEFYSGNTPEQKLSFISSLQQQGNKVMMVGDGVNDGPVLAQADISVAMQQATTLSRQSAGIYLLHNSLHGLKPLHLLSIQMRRRVIQNLYWAASYNLTAVPLALLGLVAPWQAALGMSASSLLVTLNAARINQTRSTQIKQGA